MLNVHITLINTLQIHFPILMYYTMYLMHKKIFDVLSFGGYISVNLQDIMFACLLLSSKNIDVSIICKSTLLICFNQFYYPSSYLYIRLILLLIHAWIHWNLNLICDNRTDAASIIVPHCMSCTLSIYTYIQNTNMGQCIIDTFGICNAWQCTIHPKGWIPLNNLPPPWVLHMCKC